MKKLEYLVQLLELMKGVWAPAEGFLVILKAGGFDESIIATLISLIEKAINDTRDELAKKKLTGSLTALQKLQKIEEASMKKDSEDCEALLDMLDDIA